MAAETASFLVDLLIKHPQVAPLTAIAVLIGYHLKYGVIADLQGDLHSVREKIDGMSVITYRLAKKDPETDADAVRDVLWDNGRSFPDDFDHEGRYIGENSDDVEYAEYREERRKHQQAEEHGS